MTEIKYRGAESIDYKTADLSDLQYIKIVYTDLDNEVQEVKTETNYMSDSYISLYTKIISKKEAEQEENTEENLEEQEEIEENTLKETKDVIGSYFEYINKRKEEQEREEREAKEEEARRKEEKEREERKYKADCPQEILVKFIIDGLLYTAKTTLHEVEIKSNKVYYRIKAPGILELQQHRRFYRIDLKRLCILIATDKKGSSATFISRSINLSAGGVLINRLESISSDKYVTINAEDYETYDLLLILEMDRVLKLSAKYVRQEESHPSYRYAFEFVNIGEEKTDFISKYVIRKQIEELRIEHDCRNKMNK